MYQERTYRNLIDTGELSTFRVVVQETDLQVHADRKLVAETRELVLEQRGYIEAFIKSHPDFSRALIPWQLACTLTPYLSPGEQARVVARV